MDKLRTSINKGKDIEADEYGDQDGHESHL